MLGNTAPFKKLPPERTGLVAVKLTDGHIHMVEASSFGEAASKLDVLKGTITRFEWVTGK